MVETTESIKIYKDPEIKKTPVYGVEVAVNVDFYTSLKSPLRKNDKRRELGQTHETRYDHIDAHRRDLRRLGAKNTGEALPKLGAIVASTDQGRVRHYVEEGNTDKRIFVWDTVSQLMVVVQTGKTYENDAPPPPAYIVSAYRVPPLEMDDRIKGLHGTKLIAEPEKNVAHV